MADTGSGKFRIVRTFGPGISPSESRAYRVQSTELLTEQEAMTLIRELGSPYQGIKYDDQAPSPAKGAQRQMTPSSGSR